MKMQTRNEEHWRITKTPKQGARSRDRSLRREQYKSREETGEERF